LLPNIGTTKIIIQIIIIIKIITIIVIAIKIIIITTGILGTNILMGQLVGDGDGYQKAGLPLLLAIVLLALGSTLLMIPRLNVVLKAEGSPEEIGK